VWFPVNFLLIEALRRYHVFFGDGFTMEYPTRSGNERSLGEIADDLAGRLVGIFEHDDAGARPVHGRSARFAEDPHWRDLVLFYEYFHGDDGSGVGASHQTGWTGLVAELLRETGDQGAARPTAAVTSAGTTQPGRRPMTTEVNKLIVRRAYEEAMNNRDLDLVGELFSPDYVAHFPVQKPNHGVALLQELLSAFFEAFPDIVFTVDDQVAEGDRVVTRWSAKGTHKGPWRGYGLGDGIAATGREVMFSATDIYRVADGRIVEEWNTLQGLDVLEQIGAVSTPG
jgi:predicted ester cyclase